MSRIYIVGAVGSGKTTFGKRLSAKTGFPFCELDGIVYKPDKNSEIGNKKRSVEERDVLFGSVVRQKDWIIEDAGRSYFEEGFQRADFILLLEPPVRIRNYRILKRWIKQNLHLETCLYKPTWIMLKCMFRWSKNYESGADNIKKRLLPYRDKIVILRSNKDIRSYLKAGIPYGHAETKTPEAKRI